jgi:hypothetical protein
MTTESIKENKDQRIKLIHLRVILDSKETNLAILPSNYYGSDNPIPMRQVWIDGFNFGLIKANIEIAWLVKSKVILPRFMEINHFKWLAIMHDSIRLYRSTKHFILGIFPGKELEAFPLEDENSVWATTNGGFVFVDPSPLMPNNDFLISRF